MKRSQPSHAPATSDSGSALIITLMVMALVAALGTTVATLSIRSMQSAQLAQQAGVAVDAADAGVAEAVAYLRANGVKRMCAVPVSYDRLIPQFDQAFDLATQSCVGGPGAAQRVPGQPYQVLIVTTQAYAVNVGRYTVYSRGYGAGRASRLVAADVKVSGLGTPKGLFGHAVLSSGQVTVNQSIFSTGCVYNRGHLTLSGTDSYGLPAAVHSSQIITGDNGTTVDCAATVKAIHNKLTCATGEPYDQDVLGGALPAASACITARPASVSADLWAKYYPDGSRISSAQQMFSLFGMKDPALTADEIDRLRAVAKAQGPNNYRTSTSSSDVITPSGSQAVLFYDLAAGGNVDLSGIRGFGYDPGVCLDRSLTIVVVGGNAVFHSGPPLMASVYVTSTGKSYDANGAALVGSAFADKLSLGGNTVVSPEAQTCADSNPSPSLLDFNVTAYREIDG